MKPLFISKKSKKILTLEKNEVPAPTLTPKPPKMKEITLYTVTTEKIKTIADIRRLFKALCLRFQSNVGIEDLTEAIKVMVLDNEGETNNGNK
jgi:hypothetical protein